jgi:hypothetical protein
MPGIRQLWAGLSTNAQRGVVGGGIGALAVAVGVTVALTGGSDETPPAPTTTQAITTTTTAPITTTEPETGPVAPLTGLRVEDGALLERPPLAVKIDNLDTAGETAVPQTGLLRTDIVWEEIVEGDITRLVAVFHSQQPGKVGPIRSARTTDVNLLPQLGRPLLAWSGGNAGVTAAVASSPSIVDVGWNAMPGSYARDSSRRAPHNLYAQGDELWAGAPDGLPAPTPLFGYRTDDQPNPPTAQRSPGVDLRWGGGAASAPVTWRWDAERKAYLRTQRGQPHRDSDGTQLSAQNVVVLVTEYGQSAADSRSPEALTVGSGEMFAFTNGTVVYGRWDRPDVNAPATLRDQDGQPVLLTPGQTWIELPRAGGTTALLG